MAFHRLLLVTLVAFGLGCEPVAERATDWLEKNAVPVPLPEERSAYAGTWRGDGMALSIAPSGVIHYWRKQDGGERSMTAPLRGFEGEDFKVGLAGITTTFDVQQPPQEDGGTWTMKVDGVVLTRTSKRAEEVTPRAEGEEGAEVPEFESEGTAI